MRGDAYGKEYIWEEGCDDGNVGCDNEEAYS